MSSQDRLEKVLRDIHVMISKSEAYDTDRIIVSKQDIFDLIDRLNASVYEIMDEYELTQQSREKALRENKKEGDRIIWDASRQAEDIYAASVMYTDEALNHLHGIVEEAGGIIGKMYADFLEDMKRQQETIRENQLELKSQLQLLVDSEKYLTLIEERNKEIERERARRNGRVLPEKDSEGTYKKIKPEIKINKDYFRRAGIPIEPETGGTPEGMPVEDDAGEGVIESTLRQVSAESKEISEKTAPGAADTPADAPGVSDAAGVSGAPEGAGTAGSQRGAEPAGADGAPASAGSETAGIPSGTASEQKPAAKPENEIKVNLNAEYFKRKNAAGGKETIPAQPALEPQVSEPVEKLSLLDKLMGKKK